MNSREKVKKLFNRETTDGIAIDFGGMSSSGISAVAYAKLVEALGLPRRMIKINDIFQQTAQPDLDVIEALGGDFVQALPMRLRFGISSKQWKEWTMTDGTPCLVPSEFNPVTDEKGNKIIIAYGVPYACMPDRGFYYDQTAHLLEDAEEISDLDGFPFPVMEEDEIEFIKIEVEELYENTDKAIVFRLGGSIFEQGQRDFNYENFYCNLLINKELMHMYFRRLTNAYLANLKRLLPVIGDKIQVVQFFDDLGAQTGLQISVNTYREMIMPYHKEMYAYIHKTCPEVKVLLHCCGGIFDLIPSLTEAGVDLLNPVQVSAAGMEPQKLKNAYGDKMIFWGGGADMQDFVQKTDDLDEIRKHVDGLIQTFSQGGGFVFTQIHNIQYDVPPEKVIAIYETAKKYKR